MDPVKLEITRVWDETNEAWNFELRSLDPAYEGFYYILKPKNCTWQIWHDDIRIVDSAASFYHAIFLVMNYIQDPVGNKT